MATDFPPPNPRDRLDPLAYGTPPPPQAMRLTRRGQTLVDSLSVFLLTLLGMVILAILLSMPTPGPREFDYRTQPTPTPTQPAHLDDQSVEPY